MLPPSHFLGHLLGNLPEFTAGDRKYKLNSFSNFINVNGKHQTISNGSSCNSAEVEIIKSLTKQLKSNGKPESSFAILVGYLWQLENLKKAAKKNGWSGDRILCVDTSQSVNRQRKHTTVNPEVYLGYHQNEKSISSREPH